MNTPWGQADGVEEITADIIRVYTPGHGGYGVRKGAAMPPALKSCGVLKGDWRWFEEDCQWAAVVVGFPDAFPRPGLLDTAMQSLRDWNSSAYEKHFKVVLKASESRAVAEKERKVKYQNHFITCGAWGDWAWDVPNDFVYVVGRRDSDGAEQGFLLPKEEYQDFDTLVLDQYPHFSPNKALPYTKPANQPLALA